jgi:threonine aldolase
MYSFRNDYSDGAHPEILKALAESNEVQTEGYGEDEFTLKAATLLKEKIGSENVDIHFIAGGTLTNQVAISAFLRPHEAVLSAHSGHIYVHETGAIESTGHKVIPIISHDGKLTPQQIKEVTSEHHFEHMVKPALVYISQPTEIGTIYSKSELTAISKICNELNLILYMDGARLGSALASKKNDLSLNDYSTLCDVFYAGGTKNGALFGEALVICSEELKKDFRYHLKQKGALLAKGRLLGIQFLSLFRNDLYVDIGDHANKMAEKLQSAITALGYEVQFHSYTNQIFPILPEKIIFELEKKYLFYRWEKADEQQWIIRLVCSWSTEEQRIDEFIGELKKL